MHIDLLLLENKSDIYIREIGEFMHQPTIKEISDIVTSRAGKPVPYRKISIDPSGVEEASEVYKNFLMQRSKRKWQRKM